MPLMLAMMDIQAVCVWWAVSKFKPISCFQKHAKLLLRAPPLIICFSVFTSKSEYTPHAQPLTDRILFQSKSPIQVPSRGVYLVLENVLKRMTATWPATEGSQTIWLTVSVYLWGTLFWLVPGNANPQRQTFLPQEITEKIPDGYLKPSPLQRERSA